MQIYLNQLKVFTRKLGELVGTEVQLRHILFTEQMTFVLGAVKLMKVLLQLRESQSTMAVLMLFWV